MRERRGYIAGRGASVTPIGPNAELCTLLLNGYDDTFKASDSKLTGCFAISAQTLKMFRRDERRSHLTVSFRAMSARYRQLNILAFLGGSLAPLHRPPRLARPLPLRSKVRQDGDSGSYRSLLGGFALREFPKARHGNVNFVRLAVRKKFSRMYRYRDDLITC